MVRNRISIYSVQATNRPVAVVPVRIDQTLTASRNGDVALKGVSLPYITIAVEGKEMQTDYRGRFDAGIVNIEKKDTVNITWKPCLGMPRKQYCRTGNSCITAYAYAS